VFSPRFNSKAYTLDTAPGTEPVSLAEAKTFLRVDGTSDDALIGSLIKSARIMAEGYTHRAFVTQTWKLTMDAFSDVRECFPLGGTYDLPRPGIVENGQDIRLSRRPIQSIESIETYDPENTASTVDPASYLPDTANGRIVLNEGYLWPSELREFAAVEITYIAGYTSVPEAIKQAILLIVSAMYENRQCMEMPMGATALLDQFRLPEAFGL
jgi:hypothetical protein